MDVELVDYTQSPIKKIEQFAKISHDANLCNSDEDSERFVKKLISFGHESVLECCYATFRISGISRACSHQLVRHRVASYCQRSQRYCDESEGDYVVPPTIPEELYDDIIDCVEHARNLYLKLIAYKVPREDARYFLPQAWTTELMMAMNFREIRHFLKLRLHPSAQWEIRELASKILEKCLEIAKPVFEDIEAFKSHY